MSSLWGVRRSTSDAKLAGLCAGVAAHWGVDPVLVRVGWGLLALTGGVGVVLYVAGWLLVPVEGRDSSTADDLVGGSGRGWPKEVWLVLVGIACLAAFALFSRISPFGLGPALVLAVVWYFGFYRNRARDPRATPRSTPAELVPVGPAAAPPDPVPSTPFTVAAAAWQARVQEVRAPQPGPGRSAATTVAPPVAAAPDPHAAFLAEPDPVGLYTDPPAPVPEHRGAGLAARRLRLLTVLVLGLVLTGLAVAQSAGVGVSLAVYLASALLVVALALVAATWFGRARGLLPVGALLGVAALVAALGLSAAGPGPAPLLTLPEERTVSYRSAAELPAGADRVDLGELRVDLSQLVLPGSARYAARVGAGQLVVTVPAGVGVRLDHPAGAGQLDAFGRQLGSGRYPAGSETLVPPGAGQPTLTLDLGVGFGQVEVRR